MFELRGDLIGGRFVLPSTGSGSASIVSIDPATGARVAEGRCDVGHVDLAVQAAQAALPGWRELSFDDRWAVLERFRQALAREKDALAAAISSDMGKLRSEALTEVGALLSRFALVKGQVARDFQSGTLEGYPQEGLYYRSHGVVGVIGPFNFPLHLCHAHVVPALLLGNTVVIKPSEVTPLAGEKYAAVAAEAGFPRGVVNLVQGTGAAGAAICAHPSVRAIAFTGSGQPGGASALRPSTDQNCSSRLRWVARTLVTSRPTPISLRLFTRLSWADS